MSRTHRLRQVAEEGALALRKQLNDLLVLLSLPTVWWHHPPERIADELVGVLARALRLDLVVVRLEESGIERAFPPALDGPVRAAALAAGDPGGLQRLPAPNSVGRDTARVISATLLGGAGVVAIGSWRENFPTSHERLVFRTAIDQAALALEWSGRLRAQERIERSTERIRRLQALTAAFAEALTTHEVANAAVGPGAEVVDATGAALWVLRDDDDPLAPIRLVGLWSAAPPRPTLAEPVFRDEAEGHTAYLPLGTPGRPAGLLAYRWPPGRLDPDARGFLSLIAKYTAQALERVRLYQAERRAREAAQARQRRAAFLAEASALLSSTLDCGSALASVARHAIGKVADWCVVELEPGVAGPQSSLIVAHADPTREDELRTRRRRGLREVAPGVDPTETIRSGRSALHPEVVGHDPGLGIHSVLVVPVAARGRTLGALLLATAEDRRSLGPEDLEMAEDLGRRAGLAIDNARLFLAAREADRRKDQFLAMLGHELRNPLAPIVTALQIMRLKDDDAHAPERAVIARHVAHVQRLVDDLLDVARITRGQVELRRARVDLVDVLARAVEMTSPLLEERGHHLDVTAHRGGLLVEGDEARLVQVFSNLLNNAAKYTPAGGRIQVLARREGETAVVAVRDTGIGISPELLPSMFEPFVQEPAPAGRPQGGLGLGLAIVRNLVELHGGAISAQSDGRGRGCEFVVRLPVTAASTATDRSPNGPRLSLVRSRRVLVVDDNVDAARLLGEALAMYGYEIRVAHDGPGALQVAESWHPHAALVDIGLPVMDGHEVARRLRSDPSHGHLRLIAVTGYGQPSDRERALGNGFDAHLVKPVDLDEILAALGPASLEQPAERGSVG